MIEASGLMFAFPREELVLNGVSISVGNEVVAITGASGSGKSTLLLCLAGILTPQEGRISVAGERLDGADADTRSRIRRQRLGMVFQFSELVAELTLTENVALPLELLGQPRRACMSAARTLLDELDVLDVADRHPAAVSGGQAQRAAVARALVHRPAAILADEPTGALDAANARRVLDLLLAAARRRDAAVVLVTHDPNVAARADRQVHLPSLAPLPSAALNRSGAG